MRFDPRRLTVARWWAGLRKGELATRANISSKTISAYESGASAPDDEQLSLLAGLLNVQTDFFFVPVTTLPDSSQVAFRARSKMDARTRDRAYARIAFSYDIAKRARCIFNLPSWKTSVEGLAELSPEVAARTLRAEWGLGDKPIKNTVRLLETRGVSVFSIYDDPLTLDAFSCWLGVGPAVFLSLSKTGQRQRFDAAHELGHLVLHQDGTEHATRKVEQEADRFASEFLMPTESVLAWAPRHMGLSEIARLRDKFGVSIPAMAYRLHELGLLTDWQYKNICIQISEKGLRTSEPHPIPFETSTVWKLVFKELRSQGELDDFCWSLGQAYENVSEHVFRPIPVALESPTPPQTRRQLDI